ncbi:hypothetical protein [Bradyrhizobium sp. SZCCHNR2026]|uniref:hypothetical protein n=2 Tax=unclassified Bradyrhizobium TaxID=2631580 RepID=UPI002916D17F|nr:hypothetical protein [Bradyrhizobium sp. SZCCHNR2026]
MQLKPTAASQHQALRVLTIVVGCLGMAWGIAGFARSAAVDYFEDVEARLLRFGSYSTQSVTGMLDSSTAQDLSDCDNHAQRSLLLLELPLADAALRTGATRDFDRHVESIEARAKRVLACAPRDPLFWLVLFGLEVEHGRRDRHAFDLLATSYEISPHEGWLGLRRMMVTIPIIQTVPEPLREQVLTEFQNLIRDKLPEIPARLYLGASGSTRALLQVRIDQLDVKSREAFAAMLQQLQR